MASSSSPKPTGSDQDTNSPLKLPNTIEQRQEQDELPSYNPQLPPDEFLSLESAPDLRETQEEEESESMAQHLGGSLDESINEVEEAETTSFQVRGGSGSTRRIGGSSRRKKGNQRKRIQEKKSQEKLKVLLETLRPVPFVPVKPLDFSRHEKVLRTLGLWDFVHVELDLIIHHDLVAQLIAFYNPEGRCSYVNGARINLNRADIARALKLPKKKDRLVIPDEEKELIESDEFVKFVEEFVSTWVLLQGDDTWMMPKEVVEWEKSLKEKQWDKLDWAGLFWFMVEKELKAEPPLGDCYYASHMQCLIKSQKEDLLIKEQENVDGDGKEVNVELREETDGVGDVEMVDKASELMEEEKESEDPKTELNLGQENVCKVAADEQNAGEEQLMKFGDDKKDEQETWLWSGSNAGSHFLRACNMGDDDGVMECDEEKKTEGKVVGEEAIQDVEDEEEEEEGEEEKETEKHERGFTLFANGDSLDGVAHENLMLGVSSPVAFSSGLQVHDNPTADFLGSRDEFHMIPGGSSLFGDGGKRGISHDNLISHQAHNKRMRTDEPSWEDKSSDFDICVDHIQHWVAKARMLYAEKDQACGNSSVDQQIMMNEIRQRDEMIQQLQKVKFEEQQRKDLEIYRLENELRMMESVLEGYRKALKETQKIFREHREHCPMRYEPLYKDVKGSGGLVLSAAELEKQRLKQVEEDRLRRVVLEKMVKEFEATWVEKFEGHYHNVGLFSGRLLESQNNMKLLKESVAKRKSKIPEMSECAVSS